MQVKIWHNPRCTKSRETLALLKARGVEPEVVLYLETPPSPAEIRAAAKMMKRPLRDLLRTKEGVYDALGLKGEKLDDAGLARTMSENPVLIERPVVFARGRAAIGRPPEAILGILQR